eukprot:gene3201-4132_t
MTAKTTSLPQGFIPVMLTPFLKTGAVDYEGLKTLTEFYLNAGSAGLFATCLSSEMQSPGCGNRNFRRTN